MKINDSDFDPAVVIDVKLPPLTSVAIDNEGYETISPYYEKKKFRGEKVHSSCKSVSSPNGKSATYAVSKKSIKSDKSKKSVTSDRSTARSKKSVTSDKSTARSKKSVTSDRSTVSSKKSVTSDRSTVRSSTSRDTEFDY